jgi:hypothetical protein
LILSATRALRRRRLALAEAVWQAEPAMLPLGRIGGGRARVQDAASPVRRRLVQQR